MRIFGRIIRFQRNLSFLLDLVTKSLSVFLPAVLSKKLNLRDFKIYRIPWYHNFSSLGFPTPQNKLETYQLNQNLKQGVLFPWIDQALNKLRTGDAQRKLRVLEYFAADSFYGLYALSSDIQSTSLFAVDLGNQSGEGSSRSFVLEQGRIAAKFLGMEDSFHQINRSVLEIENQCELLLDIGGLYHIEHVDTLIAKSIKTGAKIMIIQTVVHENFEEEAFFVSPAPNWTWGSRFSRNWLRQQVLNAGWNIEKEFFNILELNDRPVDRGSYYLYCVRDC